MSLVSPVSENLYKERSSGLYTGAGIKYNPIILWKDEVEKESRKV